MKIYNTLGEAYYKFTCETDETKFVLVTGDHYVKYRDKFIKVRYHPESEFKYDKIDEQFSCLITNDHLIEINGVTFWDWEDKLLPQTGTNW
jgi:hypothetical protein